MSEGFYKIGTLARLTGFGVAAIRNWERRFHLLHPVRTEGGHRLYTEADRTTLERVRDLLAAGRSIGEVATIAGDAFARGMAFDSAASPSLAAALGSTEAPGSPVSLDGALALCVLDAVPQGIIVTDASGRTEWANEAITEICGYSLAEMVGRTPGSVLQGSGSDQRAVKAMARAIAERRPCSERLLNYDHKRRPYMAEVDIAPLWLGQVFRGFVGITRDLTKNGAFPVDRTL